MTMVNGRGRSKRGADNTQASTIGDRPLHLPEAVRTSNLVDPLFAESMRHHCKKKDPQRRGAGGGNHVERHSTVWRQLIFPVALTHCFGYQCQVVAS
jgi:hypothetical protein